MSDHFDAAKYGSLSDFITPDKFRTVSEQQRTLMGFTEIAVEIQLKEHTRKLLSFTVPWDGELYGCVRDKKRLQEKLGFTSEISKVYIQDWDNRFLVLFEQANDVGYYAVYVPTEDVVYLLENCLRIPEQHGKEKK